MRIIFKLLAALSVLFGIATSASAQSFVNLNFEAASQFGDPVGSEGHYAFEAVFPGWAGYAKVNGVEYPWTYPTGSNSVNLAASGIGLVDGRLPGIYTDFFPLQGFGHAAVLQAGISPISFSYGANISLAQTAVVPTGTESLRFVTQLGADNFGVFMNGSPLTLFPLNSSTNATFWGADIHAWANQQAEMRFTVFGQDPYTGFTHALFLDSVQFSATTVPESPEFALSAVALVIFALFGKRRLAKR